MSGFRSVFTMAAATLILFFVSGALLSAQTRASPSPAAGSRASSASASSADTQIELPVSRVVLYSSGVAYFEHSGEVLGNALSRFAFKTEQINDVLKSMVLRDFGGGIVTSVSYASQDPISRALKSFAVDLSDRPAMAQIVDRLRGAEVTVNAPQAIKGRVLGIEALQKQTANGTMLVEYQLNLSTSDGLRSIPFSSIGALKLSDQRLSDEIDRALALMIDAADTQRRSVDVSFSGQGKRQVAVSYVAEAPVWKTSYRLDLSAASANAKTGAAASTQGAAKGVTPSTSTSASPAEGLKGFLQGWAIVENSSDSDWKNVRLSLVSGSPISFIQDLYTPLYVDRPVVAPSVQAQVRPRSYDQGIDDSPRTATSLNTAPANQPMAGAAMAKGAASREESYYDELADAPGFAANRIVPGGGLSNGNAAAPSAQGAKFGELFNFAIATPVNLARRQSALLPLVNKDVDAEKVSIFNSSVLPRNPLNGALIKNTSGLRLPPGPITVFDGGMYAGDALIDSFGENDQRLISYAVDLDVLVDPSANSNSEITKISVVRGVLTIQRMSSFTQSYKIQNNAGAGKTLIVEYPKNTSRTLKEPAQPMETTPNLYRFRVPVAASTTMTFTVKEQQPGTETIALLSSRPASFLYYAGVEQASPALKAALQKAADLKGNLDKLQATQNDLTQQKAQIENGQGRIRDNIDTVGRDTPQGQRYLQKLLDDEDNIDRLAKQIEQAKADIQKAQNALNDFIAALSVE